jgi:hypothetical protein
MGNVLDGRRGVRRENDGRLLSRSLFSTPINSLLGDDINRILTPPSQLPTCLDELIDWSTAASIMVSYLQENDRGSPLCRRGGPKMIVGDGLRFVPRMVLLPDDTNVNELPNKWLEKAAVLAHQVRTLRKGWTTTQFLRRLLWNV